MSFTLTVEAKVLGQTGATPAPWQIALTNEQLIPGTLRQLIEVVVQHEVVAFRARQQERTSLQLADEAQLSQAAARGKIILGGQEITQTVDPAEAVKTALQAFVDGLYFVFVDDLQLTDLANPVNLQPASRVRFIRLVALAGG